MNNLQLNVLSISSVECLVSLFCIHLRDCFGYKAENTLTLTVPGVTIDALRHFETG